MYEPSLGELERLIARNHTEVSGDLSEIARRLDQLVPREVYLADKAALEARLVRMEREQEAARSAARAAIYAAIGSVVASVVAGIVLALLLKGGH